MSRWTQIRSDTLPAARETWQNFQRHNGQWLAAALAYFAAFAIAPLIIIVVEIAGVLVPNHRQVLDIIFGYLQRDAGSGAGAVRQIVSATFNEPHRGIFAQVVTWVILVVGAIGLFNAVQFALNSVWEFTPEKSGIWRAIRQRLTGFAMLIAIAVILLLSIFVNALLTGAAAYMTHIFAGFGTLVKIADFLISFGVIWLGFAVLFKYLPECRVEWRDVWLGAALTSLLFVIGQFLLGWYLGRAAVSSGYGAFGSLVVFLIWVNYSAQIMLLGAEFTHAWAQRRGSTPAYAATRGEVPAQVPAGR